MPGSGQHPNDLRRIRERTPKIESFYAWWQTVVTKRTHAKPADIFEVMSDLYAKEWAEKFDYSQLRKFGSWPSQPASDLLNSQRLRTEGRSTAVDFWKARGARLDGNHNYAKVVRRTGAGHHHFLCHAFHKSDGHHASGCGRRATHSRAAG